MTGQAQDQHKVNLTNFIFAPFHLVFFQMQCAQVRACVCTFVHSEPQVLPPSVVIIWLNWRKASMRLMTLGLIRLEIILPPANRISYRHLEAPIPPQPQCLPSPAFSISQILQFKLLSFKSGLGWVFVVEISTMWGLHSRAGHKLHRSGQS